VLFRSPHKRLWDALNGGSFIIGRMDEVGGKIRGRKDGSYPMPNPGGRNIHTVWTIPTQCFREAHFACVDEETEALTPYGWKKHGELNDGDLIVSFDGENLKWERAEFLKYLFNGNLVAVESRDLSMRLTENHRVVCRQYRREKEWKIKQANDLIGTECLPVSAPFKGFEEDFGLCFSDSISELIGWVLTDGGYNEGKTITLYQFDKRGKISKIEKLFELLDIFPRVYHRPSNPEQMSYSFGGYYANFIRGWFPGKVGNYSVLNLWEDQSLNKIWKGMVEGDGNERKDKRITFVGTKEKVDFFQALSIRLGKTCRVSKRKKGNAWNAYVSNRNTTSLRNTNGKGTKLFKVNYKGIVWCPKIPLGMWIARRNGRPFITGNTYPEELALRCVKAGTSERGYCPKCGFPWVRVIEREKAPMDVFTNSNAPNDGFVHSGMTVGDGKVGHGGKLQKWRDEHPTETFSWRPSCSCVPDPVPGEIIESCIKAGTSEKGYCPKCGNPWVRVVEKINLNKQPVGGKLEEVMETGFRHDGNIRMGDVESTTVDWKPSCNCKLDPVPGIVLDPFSGSATTGSVAEFLGRKYVGLELKPDYIEISKRRVAGGIKNKKILDEVNPKEPKRRKRFPKSQEIEVSLPFSTNVEISENNEKKIATVVNVKNSVYDVYIGRWNPKIPIDSKFKNPFKIGVDGDRLECIQKFKEYFYSNPSLQADALKELKGKILGCWCEPEICHGWVISGYVNGMVEEENK
jgi:hypothetical protein